MIETPTTTVNDFVFLDRWLIWRVAEELCLLLRGGVGQKSKFEKKTAPVVHGL